jgi:hypothetical protein
MVTRDEGSLAGEDLVVKLQEACNSSEWVVVEMTRSLGSF